MPHLKKSNKDTLKKKFNTYLRHVMKYNETFGPHHKLSLPTLETIEAAAISDVFWDGGPVSHPDEPWATGDYTKKGIQLFLTQRSCKEEMRRIASECCQLIHWAIEYNGRINMLKQKEDLESVCTSLTIRKITS